MKYLLKLFAIGFLIVLGLMVTVRFFNTRSYVYRDTTFEKHYTWKDIEVGTVIRFPVGKSVPNGRYCAVMAINRSKNETRILGRTQKSEVPKCLSFASGEEGKVIYQRGDEKQTYDLTRLEQYPLRPEKE